MSKQALLNQFLIRLSVVNIPDEQRYYSLFAQHCSPVEVMGTLTAFNQELARTKYSIYFKIYTRKGNSEQPNSVHIWTLSQKEAVTSVIFSD